MVQKWRIVVNRDKTNIVHFRPVRSTKTSNDFMFGGDKLDIVNSYKYLGDYLDDHLTFNILRPRQNERHFADDTVKRTFVNENVRILIEISLKFVPKGPINNIPASVQIMAWRRPGDKSLSEPMMVCLPTHICVTRPQWVKETVDVLVSSAATALGYIRFKLKYLKGCRCSTFTQLYSAFVCPIAAGAWSTKPWENFEKIQSKALRYI